MIKSSYFLFSGITYGPSGEIKHIPLRESDIKLNDLIRQIMSFGIQGTLILEDPEREKLVLDMLDELAQMVR